MPVLYSQGKPTIDLSKAIAEQHSLGYLLAQDLNIKALLKFNPDKETIHHQLPFSQTAYIDLVEWTGRTIRNDKRGHINPNLPPILERMDIDVNRWLSSATQFESIHRKRFGNKPKLRDTG